MTGIDKTLSHGQIYVAKVSVYGTPHEAAYFHLTVTSYLLGQNVSLITSRTSPAIVVRKRGHVSNPYVIKITAVPHIVFIHQPMNKRNCMLYINFNPSISFSNKSP